VLELAPPIETLSSLATTSLLDDIVLAAPAPTANDDVSPVDGFFSDCVRGRVSEAVCKTKKQNTTELFFK
jgi:hypothetical protein